MLRWIIDQWNIGIYNVSQITSIELDVTAIEVHSEGVDGEKLAVYDTEERARAELENIIKWLESSYNGGIYRVRSE